MAARGSRCSNGWIEWRAPVIRRAILWTFAALVLLVIVLIIVKLIRSLTFGTFVAGGRNRKTRLAVMDATAVDSQRRLVLVRRDDIEHLLLIGGPTDVVVERDIRMSQPRRPALTARKADTRSLRRLGHRRRRHRLPPLRAPQLKRQHAPRSHRNPCPPKAKLT